MVMRNLGGNKKDYYGTTKVANSEKQTYWFTEGLNR